MGQNTEELRREIEQTRNGLGDTLEAIGDRVSPSRAVQRRKNRMTGALRSARERVMGVGNETRHAIGDGTHSLATSVKDGTASVRDGVTGTAGSAVETLHQMPQRATTQAQGSPMAAGAIAFGIGFIAAAAFPPSRVERQAAAGLVERVEPIKTEMSTVAHEMADHLKEPAQEALGAVKNTAAEGAQSIQDSAKEAAQATTQEGRDALGG